MKKTLRQFAVVMGLMSYFLMAVAVPVGVVRAEEPGKKPAAPQESLFPLPGAAVYGNGIPAPVKGSAEDQFAELVWGIINNVRYVIGAVAIGMIVCAGFRMVTGFGNDEVYGKQRLTILYGIIGLAIVGMAGEFARIFAVGCTNYVPVGQSKIGCTPGGFLKDPNSLVRTATIFSQRTQMIITFIKYFIGSITILMIVRNALRMVTMGSAEDKVALDKKNLIYSAIGLILIVVSDNAISNVLYKLDISKYPTSGGVKAGLNPGRGITEIVGFTNFIVSIVGPLAVLVLLAGGIMYITAAGNDDRMGTAKRMMVSALIGIIIIYGAFAIVSTFIAGSFNPEDLATPFPLPAQ